MAAFLILEPRCVFLHIPKTGGASIRLGAFENNYEGPVQGSVPDEWKDLFTFTFVRNPFDRLISAWRMFASGMEKTIWELPDDGNREMSLRQFLDVVLDESIPFDGRRDTTKKKIRHHAIPQTHPFHCLEQADFVGRFESLEEDFAEVLKRLGAENRPLPHMNRSRQGDDFMKHYDAETWQIATEYYRQDFEQLGYEVTPL